MATVLNKLYNLVKDLGPQAEKKHDSMRLLQIQQLQQHEEEIIQMVCLTGLNMAVSKSASFL